MPLSSSPSSVRRVLLVTDEMEVGGTQRQIVNLACGLKACGTEVAVLYFRKRSFLVDSLVQSGVEVMHCAKRGSVDLRFLVALSRQLRQGRFDVVHAFAFSAELWSAMALLLSWPGSKPVLISSVRGTYDWYRPWHWRLKRWVAQRSAAVVANSRQGARFAALKMRLPETAISVVYNGIQPHEPAAHNRNQVRRSWPAGDASQADALHLLFVGRLVDIKGVDTLLKALALVHGQGEGLPPCPRLAVCGDGPLREALEQQVDALGLREQVAFLGERADVAVLVAACDALVLPSRQEGLSNALLEAMAAQRAVVASARGGTVELIEHEVTGLLFEAGDAAALASALQRLTVQPGFRALLGQRASAFVDQRFSVADMVAAMQDIYRGAVQRPEPLRPGALRRETREEVRKT